MDNKLKGISLLSASIISSYAAAQYVIVAQETYIIAKGYEDVVVSEWTDQGTQSCSNDLNTSDVYHGESFTQTETCDQLQTRTVDTYYVTYKGDRELQSSETENQTITTTSTSTETGAHLEPTCKDILSNGFSKGDSNYVISQSGNPTVYCDMTRNGGGWMRVLNHNWYEDRTAPNSDFQSTSGKVIVDTQSVARNLPDAFWVNDWATSSLSSGERWKKIEATPIHAWSESMVDFDGYGFRSLDGWHPSGGTHQAVVGDVNGQYMDGFSLTYGNQGSLNHLHSFPIGHKNDATPKATNLPWLDDSYVSYGDQGVTVSTYIHQMILNNLVIQSKPLGNEKITLKFMADQQYSDESIGFRKYILWVR